MKIVETYEFNIAKHFACLIEYGNEGGYTEEEEQQVDTFLQTLTELTYKEGATSYVIDYGDTDDTNFTRCEICHLMADCCEIKVNFFN